MNATPNEKKSSAKKQGRFNFIDLILILLLFAVIAALVYVFSPDSWIRDMMKNEEKTIQYTVEITNVDEKYLDLINKNDVVSDSVTKSSIGNVTTVSYNAYNEYQLVENTTADAEGNSTVEYSLNALKYPDKYNILVTITVNADYAEEIGYTVDSTRIAVGEKMYLKFPNFVCEGYCIGITNAD